MSREYICHDYNATYAKNIEYRVLKVLNCTAAVMGINIYPSPARNTAITVRNRSSQLVIYLSLN